MVTPTASSTAGSTSTSTSCPFLSRIKKNFFVVLLCLRFLHDYLFPFSIRYYNQIFECVYDFKWYPFDTQVRKTRSQLFSDKGRNHEDKYLPLWISSVLQHCPPSREESERVCSTNPISIWVLRTDGPYSSNLSPIMFKVCKRWLNSLILVHDQEDWNGGETGGGKCGCRGALQPQDRPEPLTATSWFEIPSQFE